MVSTSIIVLKIPVGITDGLDPDRDRVNAIDLDWIDLDWIEVDRAERTYGC